MKKMLIIILAAALVFLGVVGVVVYGTNGGAHPAATERPTADDGIVLPTAAPAEPAGDDAAEPDEAAEIAAGPRVDLEALYTSRDPESIYATVGGREITWEEYYQWLGTNVLSAENYFDTMAASGTSIGWDQDYTAGTSFAAYVIDGLNENLHLYKGVDLFAEANGIVVTEEEVDERLAEEQKKALGEDVTEEDWALLLVKNFLTDSIFRTQIKASLQVNKAYEEFYGEHGEKLSPKDLQHYLEESGYLRCNHILFMTIDPDTREALDEDTAAEKKAQAETVAAELQAIQDKDELLTRFAALKEELDEDGGKVYYPEGYIFTPGTMVAVFEDTTRSLEEYQVSDPVLSEYGYHVIIRLPITGETTLDDGSTIADKAANQAMASRLDEFVEAQEFSYAPGVEPVDLLAYLK